MKTRLQNQYYIMRSVIFSFLFFAYAYAKYIIAYFFHGISATFIFQGGAALEPCQDYIVEEATVYGGFSTFVSANGRCAANDSMRSCEKGCALG